MRSLARMPRRQKHLGSGIQRWKWIPAKLVLERSNRGYLRERQIRIDYISFLEWAQ